MAMMGVDPSDLAISEVSRVATASRMASGGWALTCSHHPIERLPYSVFEVPDLVVFLHAHFLLYPQHKSGLAGNALFRRQ